MARYRVDWCIDDVMSLKEMLDELSREHPTLRVVSVSWQPDRPVAIGRGVNKAGYTVVSECE